MWIEKPVGGDPKEPGNQAGRAGQRFGGFETDDRIPGKRAV